MGFVKIMGWEMGLEPPPPLQDPLIFEALDGYFWRNRRPDNPYWWNEDLRDWSDDLEITAFRQNINQSDLKKLNMKIISHLITNQTLNVEISLLLDQQCH